MAARKLEMILNDEAGSFAPFSGHLLIATTDGAIEEAYLLHDLKNYLQSIGSALNILHRSRGATDVGLPAQALTVARAAIERARRVILTLTERRIADEDPGGVKVDALLRGMLPLLEVVMGEDVDVHLACGAPDVPLSYAARHVENAVVNLALNARAAMPNGGRLDVASAVISDPKRPILRISVRDSGLGMEPGIRRLVEGNSLEPRVDGSGGLGLASIRAFARAASGSVEVESEVGRGTTISLHLPL